MILLYLIIDQCSVEPGKEYRICNISIGLEEGPVCTVHTGVFFNTTRIIIYGRPINSGMSSEG